MKNGTPRRLGLAIVSILMPATAVHAFIDERSPTPPAAPPLAQIAPEITAPKIIVPLNQQAATAVPGVNTVTGQIVAAGVTGDLSAAAWTSAYPGPFGTMPLADAIIAQVVPVLGTAIQLDGPPELLAQSVVVPTGASRASTLRAVAESHGVNINLAGTKVSLQKAGVAPAQTPPASAAAADTDPTPLPYVAPETKPVEPAPAPKKIWHLAKGTMLSTAMMEWAQQWNWDLIWQAEVDYRIAADIKLNETFLDGIGKVLDAYRSGPRPLWGDWNDEQKVIVIREPNNKK